MSLIAYKIPGSLSMEIDELESQVSAFHNNEISETELKIRRVPFGVYEQRKKGTYMVRVRCTAGIITPKQLKRVAELSLQFASGSLHVTTRQEIQIHDVAIENLIPVIRELADCGLSTRGGGGNTVRNITVPWNSGIAIDEIFDVTPYAVALTSELIAQPDSWLLPRKYKIAFSNSDKNSNFVSVNDLGLMAQIKNGVHGFKVFVAGGMGRQSQPGHLLHDFVPVSELFIITEAIKRVFSKYGNRKNKHAARLRFVWNTLGRDRFIAIYNEERALLLGEGIKELKIEDIVNEITIPVNIIPAIEKTPEFEIWKKRYVGFQKQSEANTVRIPLLFGIIGAEKVKALADALIPFGDNILRLTNDQNIVLRNISSNYLGNIYNVARKTSDLSNRPSLFGNAVACAGASTCQLGICRARGALEGIIDRLNVSSVNIDTLSDIRVHISGCSNTCGQHIIADLGFFGKVGREEQHSYPVYSIVAGAKSDSNGNVQLAEKIDDINAHDLPLFVEAIAQHYSDRKSQYPDFAAYLNAEGRDFIHKTCDKYREIPSFDTDRSYYRDWGDTEIFSLAGKGTGECSAGLFDLIEIDLARLRQIRSALSGKENAISGKDLYNLVLVSSRMLLITRGVEATSDKDVFDKFAKLFIGENLVDVRFLPIIVTGRKGNVSALSQLHDDIITFSNTIEELYMGMDNSLQFKVIGKTTAVSCVDLPIKELKVDFVKDLRNVCCPMNFVKTKLALSQISEDHILEVILDDGPPIENVQKSVAEEGHTIISKNRVDNYWKVWIKKKKNSVL